MSRKIIFGWLSALVFLVALTIVVLQVFGARRRAYVPEMVLHFPAVEIRSAKGVRYMPTWARGLAFASQSGYSSNTQLFMVNDAGLWYKSDLNNEQFQQFGKRPMRMR